MKQKKNKRKKKILFTSIFDPKSIEKIYKSKDKVQLELGAKIDSLYGPPLKCHAKIIKLFDDPMAKKSALIDIDGIHVVVTEARTQYSDFEKFKRLGMKSFEDYDIYIVKIGYLEPDLKNASNGWVMALTQGPVNQDLKSIGFKNLKRPIFPLDEIEYKDFNFINNW